MEESDYEENNMMKENDNRHEITLEGLRGEEEFAIDGDNQSPPTDWVLPTLQKDHIYKKSIFEFESKYVCERMEGDLEIKDWSFDVGEINLINWKSIERHNKDKKKYKYLHVGVVKIQISPLHNFGKDIDLYALVCYIRHNNFHDQIVSGIKRYLCNGIVGFNCRPGYYVSLKDVYSPNFPTLKLKTVGIDMKEDIYPLRVFWKIIYKLDNTMGPKQKVTMVDSEKFEAGSPKQMITPIKTRPHDIKLDKRWITSFDNPTKLMRKNVVKIDEMGKITTKPKLLRSQSTIDRRTWEEGSTSFGK